MKLERLPEYLTITIVTIIGMLFAIYCGQHTGPGDLKRFGLILGLIVVAMAVIHMRTRIWVLIPICWPMATISSFIPAHLSLRNVAIVIVFGAFLAFKALKLSRIRPTFGWVDFAVLINVLYVASVFIRNPTGTFVMQTAKVGGRPYFEVILALLAYWVLVRIRIQPSSAQRISSLMIVGSFCEGVLNFITMKALLWAPTNYAGGNEAGGGMGETTIEREGYLVGPARSVFHLLVARFSPTTLLNPIYLPRFLLALLTICAALMSGFRSLMIEMGFAFFASLYLRKGAASILASLLIALPLTTTFIGLQGHVFQLPLTAQRALCFLPGKWDPVALENAQASSAWRIEIWKSVLGEGNKYISDKVWGDGFGFTMAQLQEMARNTDAQENFRISGDYHSGPISAIRCVGCVGLAIFYVLILSVAKGAWRLIEFSRKTPYFYLALFVGIPMLTKPVMFTLVFGSYGSDIVGAIYNAALLNMIVNSVTDYKRSISTKPEPSAGSAVVQRRRFRPAS